MTITADEYNFLAVQVHKQYNLCLAYDCMPVNTKFAVFSENNPYCKVYDNMLRFLWKMQSRLHFIAKRSPK